MEGRIIWWRDGQFCGETDNFVEIRTISWSVMWREGVLGGVLCGEKECYVEC